MKLEHFLTPYTKINSKWIKDLNVRPETIKLLEENIGKILSDIHHSRILYDPPPRILEIKAKRNKWDLIKVSTMLRKEVSHACSCLDRNALQKSPSDLPSLTVLYLQGVREV